MKLPSLTAGEDLPAPPRQARSAQRRQAILDAARRLFAEKGYEGTAVEDITAAAGAAAGAFYTYFRSKRQLLIILMDELLQRLGVVDLKPQGNDLRSFLLDVFRTDMAYFGAIRAWQEAALADPELGKMQQKIEAWTGARILRVFEALQQPPDARPDRDLRAFARMMDRHFWSLLARGSRMAPRDFRREVELAAEVIERYLFRDTARR